jgi:hypothetical protein
MNEEHAEDIQQVIERLEVLHGDIISRLDQGELDDTEAGKAVAYEQAIRLIESARDGGLDMDRDELTDDEQAEVSNAISASRAWRREHE